MLPPTADGVHCEAGRIVVDAHTDPTFVATQVIHPVGDRLALGGYEEVVHLHTLGLSLQSPLTSGILEVADQLFLLRIDRDDRLTLRLMVAHLVIEIDELSVPIRMRGSFPRLAIRLQRVAKLMEQTRDDLRTYGVPHGLQLGGQFGQALRRPAKRIVVRSARRDRLDQCIEVRQQRNVRIDDALTATPRVARTLRGQRRLRPQLLDATRNPCPRNPCGAIDHRDAAMANRLRLSGRPQTLSPLRQHRRKRLVLRSQRVDIHAPNMTPITSEV